MQAPRAYNPPSALRPLAEAVRKAGAAPTRHNIGRLCYALTGHSIGRIGLRQLAATVKRARKAGALAPVAAAVFAPTPEAAEARLAAHYARMARLAAAYLESGAR